MLFGNELSTKSLRILTIINNSHNELEDWVVTVIYCNKNELQRQIGIKLDRMIPEDEMFPIVKSYDLLISKCYISTSTIAKSTKLERAIPKDDMFPTVKSYDLSILWSSGIT